MRWYEFVNSSLYEMRTGHVFKKQHRERLRCLHGRRRRTLEAMLEHSTLRESYLCSKATPRVPLPTTLCLAAGPQRLNSNF